MSVTLPAVADDEPDELMPGRVSVVKAAKLAKFVAKPAAGSFDLPDPANDPAAEGATLRLFDTVAHPQGDFTFDLPAGARWRGLGNPAGSRGYKYKGSGALGDPCKLVLIKENLVKAVCKGPEVDFSLPFQGDLGVVLTVGTSSKRYCAQYGGTPKGNPSKIFRRKDAPAPAMCPGTAATTTPSVTDTPMATATPTPTQTPIVGCLLSQGSYTLSQTAMGSITVDGLPPIGFPAGSTSAMVVDLGAASPPGCLHDAVVPFPGGFGPIVICQLPGTGFTIRIEQSGCGVGRADSNGGSDFTVSTVADTSDTFGVCGVPHTSCNTANADDGARVEVTVGDGFADTCSSGAVNVVATVPVDFTIWLDETSACPDADGVFDGGDILISQFSTVLDLSTDTTDATWVDLDGDGCSLAGAGPGGAGLSETGTCLDSFGGTVATAFASPVATDHPVFFDHSIAGLIPFAVSGPAAPLGASCPSPPSIDFDGTATRCFP
jgi:hypothetical protein